MLEVVAIVCVTVWACVNTWATHNASVVKRQLDACNVNANGEPVASPSVTSVVGRSITTGVVNSVMGFLLSAGLVYRLHQRVSSEHDQADKLVGAERDVALAKATKKKSEVGLLAGAAVLTAAKAVGGPGADVAALVGSTTKSFKDMIILAKMFSIAENTVNDNLMQAGGDDDEKKSTEPPCTMEDSLAILRVPTPPPAFPVSDGKAHQAASDTDDEYDENLLQADLLGSDNPRHWVNQHPEVKRISERLKQLYSSGSDVSSLKVRRDLAAAQTDRKGLGYYGRTLAQRVSSWPKRFVLWLLDARIKAAEVRVVEKVKEKAVPLSFFALGAVLIGLGLWQIQRRKTKLQVTRLPESSVASQKSQPGFFDQRNVDFDVSPAVKPEAKIVTTTTDSVVRIPSVGGTTCADVVTKTVTFDTKTREMVTTLQEDDILSLHIVDKEKIVCPKMAAQLLGGNVHESECDEKSVLDGEQIHPEAGKSGKKSGKSFKRAAYRKRQRERARVTHAGTKYSQAYSSRKADGTARDVNPDDPSPDADEEDFDYGPDYGRVDRLEGKVEKSVARRESIVTGITTEHLVKGSAVCHAPELYVIKREDKNGVITHSTVYPSNDGLAVPRHMVVGAKTLHLLVNGVWHGLDLVGVVFKTLHDAVRLPAPKGVKIIYNKGRVYRDSDKGEPCALHWVEESGKKFSTGVVGDTIMLGADAGLTVKEYTGSSVFGSCGGVYVSSRDNAIIGWHGMCSASTAKPMFYPMSSAFYEELCKISTTKPNYRVVDDVGYEAKWLGVLQNREKLSDIDYNGNFEVPKNGNGSNH